MILLKQIFLIRNILFFLFFVFFHFNCRNTDFDYPMKRRLNNGNYLLMTTKGIYLYNEEFTSKIDKVIFESRMIEDNNYAYSEDIRQFLTEDNGFIICLIRNETYILSKTADLLCHITLDYIYYRVAYQIVPYGHSNNDYFFAIICVEKNSFIFRNYIFHFPDKNVELEGIYNYSCSNTLRELSISCELMNYNNDKVIVCFSGEWSYSYIFVFNTTSFSPISERTGQIIIDNFSGGLLYTSNVNLTNREEVVCCVSKLGNLLCFGYNINTNNFSQVGEVAQVSQCKDEILQIRVEYFPETVEYLVGCSSEDYSYYLATFSSNFNFTVYNKIENVFPSNCSEVNVFNILYSSSREKYSILTDSTNCQNKRVFNFETISSNKINDFPTDEPSVSICDGYHTLNGTECYNNIPTGYFCNDTLQKIIYKCHDNCKTCNKESTDDNNNCLTCPESGKKYLDLGNCTSDCSSRGFFIDPNDSTITRCKCLYDEKCLYCTKESIAYNNSCIICNSNYYPKQNDESTINSFIKCYKDPDGYYLEEEIYKPCYSTCKKCYGFGNDSDHNCKECIDNYELNTDFNKNNCYLKCNNYFYYDENNKYKCTSGYNCPDNYKLINSSKKCINDCSKDETHVYEYNNICYDNCPSETYISYNHSLCLNKIPDGYYCNNSENRTLDKCHHNCKTCNSGPTDVNNNCLSCPDIGTMYLDLGNCLSDCSNRGYFSDPINNTILRCKCSNPKCLYCTSESIAINLCIYCNTELNYYPKKNDSTIVNLSYIDCYNETTISEGYYLNNNTNQYEPCYTLCKKCTEFGNEDEHKCEECISGYELIMNFNNVKNCYRTCNHYFYFDINDSYQYKCTTSNDCPTGYKLINGTKKCIDDCSKDKIYNKIYEYNNICYEILICEFFYNYEHTSCLTKIEDGFYCNSTSLKTIDKCHDNCKTCDKGPTNDNNNCLTCPDTGTIYFDLGNCTDKCDNGHYEDTDSIQKCKCTKDISCKICSEESIKLGFCISCNNDEGYYQKSDENSTDGLIKCYKNPEGYYFDTDRYYPCYSTCKFCEEAGEKTHNKCIECKEGYEFKNDFVNDTNCYQKCNYNYYYDSDNNYHCTNNDSCPAGFTKLISIKKRCIDDCINDNIYKFDYNNNCLTNCPNSTHENDHKCEGNLNCELEDKFYNYDMTECIDKIEDGFYCNNTSLKTIDKCHDNCKTCDKGPTNDNNNCLTCPDTGTIYFDLGNCTDKCDNGHYEDTDSIQKCKCTKDISCKICSEESIKLGFCISCNNDEGYYQKSDENSTDGFIKCYKNPENYFLDNNIYRPCYLTCKNCLEDGNSTNHNCLKCKEGYSFKTDFENDNNCYKICTHNYYYDLNNIYHCTEENSCPENFNKLITQKKRCIDICSKDSIYQYEYNNTCLIECPIETYIDKNNDLYKCLDNLYCEMKDKYYNYDMTECIDKIEDGFYCNNTSLKTIDKCHDNCKTCDKGPTNDNNNCLTCPDTGTIYFDLGNCTDKCDNGHFIDNSINKCKCSSNITCEICSVESMKYNLCESCNIEDGYYPKINDSINIGKFINCYNKDTISQGYYLNINTKQYEVCFSKCKNCDELGDEYNNKCTECFPNYGFKYDFKNDRNCYEICEYNYYFNNSVYFCTKDNNCPEEYNLLVKDKKRCIDKCIKDNNYKYQYRNNCFTNCPENTISSKNNLFICEPIEGSSMVQELLDEINPLLEKFPSENSTCENNYVNVEENEKNTIYIYKNNNCSEETPNLPIVDFGECYEIIKKLSNIDEDEELIVSKVELKENHTSVYSFYHPYTLEKLDTTPCHNKSIIVQENVTQKLIDEIEDSKETLILDLISQGINVFNISDEFYTDLCYHYNSKLKKDVPIKARLTAFFPNITLCEKGCENVGLDIENMKAKCECKFIDIVDIDSIKNVYTEKIEEIIEIISELNIAVLKCFKDIFNKEYFVKNTGGFIIIALFTGQVCCFIKYMVSGLYFIRKYVFNLTNSYTNYLNENNNSFINNHINSPPQKKRKNGKSFIEKEKNCLHSKSILLNNKKMLNSNVERSSSTKSPNDLLINKKDNNINTNTSKNVIFNVKKKRGKNKSILYRNVNHNEKINTNNYHYKCKSIINMEAYLSNSFDENDFDDVIDKDKRRFIIYFCQKYRDNQIFINTFCIKDIFRPQSLKILVLIMTIELYFVINALFYNEDYLSDLFFSDKEEKFYSFIPRRVNEFIYTSTTSIIISYFVSYVFIDENKIKKIFRRNKERDNIKLKYEVALLVKTIERRFNILIIFSLGLTIISFIYISCFNNVYPYIKKEWIKSSIFILILMQIINFVSRLIECILRYSSIKCNSEKIFRLSQVFTL